MVVTAIAHAATANPMLHATERPAYRDERSLQQCSARPIKHTIDILKKDPS